MGLNPEDLAKEAVEWDVWEAVLTPGDLLLLVSWESEDNASSFAKTAVQNHISHQAKRVRTIRDYGKFDRREAPQFYEDASGRETIH